MANIDLLFPRSPRRHCFCVPGTIFLSFALFAATQARSQDVAEAARQERAKKDSGKKSKHIYNNDDLKQAIILTPEDRDQIQAKKNQNPSPSDKPADSSADSIDAQTAPAQIPLGDVARANRKQKLLQQKLQPRQSAQFHLPFANAPLAAPKPPVFSVIKAPANSLVITRPPQRPPVGLQPSVRARKRSPFDRRLLPASPAIRPSLIVPSLPGLNSNLRPVVPTVENVLPSPVVSVAPKPSAPAIRSVVVQPGDSLWKLAQQNLGRGLRWHDLVAANPGIADPDRIVVGSRILVPASPRIVSQPSTSPSKIKVQRGDTLWSLAHTHLGQASSWTCIAQANPLVLDPNRIYTGQELLLSANCSVPLP